jgi:hypothetical protein
MRFKKGGFEILTSKSIGIAILIFILVLILGFYFWGWDWMKNTWEFFRNFMRFGR